MCGRGGGGGGAGEGGLFQCSGNHPCKRIAAQALRPDPSVRSTHHTLLILQTSKKITMTNNTTTTTTTTTATDCLTTTALATTTPAPQLPLQLPQSQEKTVPPPHHPIATPAPNRRHHYETPVSRAPFLSRGGSSSCPSSLSPPFPADNLG